MDFLKSMELDGKCTTGAKGLTPEEVVAKYPEIIVQVMKEQQATISRLQSELEHITLSRDTLAEELLAMIEEKQNA